MFLVIVVKNGKEMTMLHGNFGNPDMKTTLPGTEILVINLNGGSVTQVELQPGWEWKTNVGSTVGTESCLVPHFGQVLKGQLYVEMDTGESFVLHPGDVYCVPAGHHARVVGDVPYVAVDFSPATAEYGHPA